MKIIPLATSLLSLTYLLTLPLAGQAQAKIFTYKCQDGETFQTEFLPEQARLILNRNHSLILPLVVSASGAKYSDGSTTFWTKGNTAFVEINKLIVHQNCSTQQAMTPPQNQSLKWRKMTQAEEMQAWKYILNSRLGIAALNQLAIEGFISPTCPKTFYINEQSGGFQSLLQVKCPEPRGASIAVGYEEIRVIFNRFEDNIENFQVERISQEEGQSGTPLN